MITTRASKRPAAQPEARPRLRDLGPLGDNDTAGTPAMSPHNECTAHSLFLRERMNLLDRLHKVTRFFDGLTKRKITTDRVRQLRTELAEPDIENEPFKRSQIEAELRRGESK